MEQHATNVSSCLNTNIYSYLETTGGQSSNLYLKVIHFVNTNVNKTSVAAAFLHWCIIRGVLLITAVKSFIFQATIVTFAEDPKSLFDNENEAFVSILKLNR
jgi:hypothetical protein